MKKIKGLVIAGASLLLAVILVGCGSQSGKSLVVSTFGSSTPQRTSDIFNPFHQKSGIKINPQFSNDPSRFTQMEKNPDSNVDVAELSESNSVIGMQHNVFKKLNLSKIKNFKELSPAAQSVAKKTDSVPFSVNSIGIMYNPKKVGKITSFKQLWSSKLRKKIAIPTMSGTEGPGILAIAGDVANKPIEKDGGVGAFQELKALKPNIYKTYSEGPDLVNMVKSGQVDVAIIGDYNVNMLKQADKNLQYTIPNGTYANYDMLSILKNSKNEKNAYKYINYRLSKESQTKVAQMNTLNDPPVNSNVKLSGASATDKTYGMPYKVSKTLDYKFVNSHLSSWINKWNQIINQ
ncbi:spermidine/putrescine ABC transporter substrate-binding protein [Philodulcilactobacillus myokoensis]|uniref:Spermidine/putrescine ABC transporter substrate-binding protein n=1 Tax=Philodulcilactobacillus myokoensis TaxID=2929573 RepID=A0A9W6ESL7_9LACO|nr:extracellular solute-binding protein [Philodulcilactobacillus myokoensis]GLB46463.1 spermidine/putrescine ABC transporter substrate-binding protein [Philodulcilactobacillus myokoensis]